MTFSRTLELPRCGAKGWYRRLALSCVNRSSNMMRLWGGPRWAHATHVPLIWSSLCLFMPDGGLNVNCEYVTEHLEGKLPHAKVNINQAQQIALEFRWRMKRLVSFRLACKRKATSDIIFHVRREREQISSILHECEARARLVAYLQENS